MSSYDNWKTNDHDAQAELDDADYQLQELNNKLAEFEDELAESLETNGDPEWVKRVENDIFDTRGQITDLNRKLGITEF